MTQQKKYKVLENYQDFKQGDIVYSYEDSLHLVSGTQCIDVSKKPNSRIGTSIPLTKLEEIPERQVAASASFAAAYGDSTKACERTSVSNTHIKTHKP